MDEGKRNKTRLAKKPLPPEKRTGFRPGRWGVCEAPLWEFTGPGEFLAKDKEIPVKRVAAESLDDALKFMRLRYPDFIVVKAVAGGMIVMLSGSPFE